MHLITLRHSTLGRTPVDEGSARSRDLYLTTHNTEQETDIHAPGGIRTRNPSKRAVADSRLRPRGHCDRPDMLYVMQECLFGLKCNHGMYTAFLRDFTTYRYTWSDLGRVLHLCLTVCWSVSRMLRRLCAYVTCISRAQITHFCPSLSYTSQAKARFHKFVTL